MSRFIFPRQGVKSQNLTPADGAKLHFYYASTVTPKDTYTDSGFTTPSSNPVIADATGLFAAIFIQGAYDVKLTDKNDVQLWSAETISATLSSSETFKNFDTIDELVADTGGSLGDQVAIMDYDTGNNSGVLFGTLVAAATATADGGSHIDLPNTTPALQWKQNFAHPINAKSFGVVGDNSTDDTTQAQAAINYAATTSGYAVYFPSSTYLVSTLYTYHDAANNIGYPSGAQQSGRISIAGDRRMAQASLTGGQSYYGTVFRTSSTTGNAFVLGDGSTNCQCTELKNFTIVGTSTAALVDANKVVQFSNFENLSMKNDGTGGTCFHVRGGMWVSTFRNLTLTCQGSSLTGTPFIVESASICHFDNITCSYGTVGFLYGTAATADSDKLGGQGSTFTNFQATNNADGVHFMGGSGIIINGLWIEAGSDNGAEECNYDLKIDNLARNYTINNLNSTTSVASGSLVNFIGSDLLGGNSGTSYTDRIDDIVFNSPRLGQIENWGFVKYAGCGYLEINNPILKRNGGKAVVIEDVDLVIATGAHDGGDGAAIMTDSSEAFGIDQYNGFIIKNTTDGSRALITDNNATTVSGTLSGGTDNDWDDGDTFQIVRSVSPTYINNPDFRPREATQEIATGNRVVNLSDTNSPYLVTEMKSNSANVSSALDMSTWSMIPRLLRATTSGGSFTIDLPLTNLEEFEMKVWRESAGNNVTLDAGSGNTINGAQTLATTAQYEVLHIVNVGAGEWVTV